MPCLVGVPERLLDRRVIPSRATTNARLDELAERIVTSLVVLTRLHHNCRDTLDTVRALASLIVVDKEGEERNAPRLHLLIQHVITRLDIAALINHGVTLRQETAVKRNDTDTAPSATIHGVDRRHTITREEDLARNLEALLILEETTGFNKVLTRELLHTSRINRLILIRLFRLNEAASLNAHNIRIRSTRLRAFPSECCRAERTRLLPKNTGHKLYEL